MSGISVVICSYNGEKYITEQIDSILCQTVKPDEIILCDDNSTDKTYEIATSILAKSGISYKSYQNVTNLGYAKNYEKALGLSSQQYVSMSDQDDIWCPWKLETLLVEIKKLEDENGIEHPIMVYSDVTVTDEALNILHPSYMKMQKLFPERMNKRLYALCVNNVVIGMTAIVNRGLLKKALPFPEGVLNHDWWLAIISSAIGTLSYIGTPLGYYRQHGNNSIGTKVYDDLGWFYTIRSNFRNHSVIYKYLTEYLPYELFHRYRPHLLKRIPHILGLYQITGDKRLLMLAKNIEKGGMLSALGCLSIGALPPAWQRKLFFLISLSKKVPTNTEGQ